MKGICLKVCEAWEVVEERPYRRVAEPVVVLVVYAIVDEQRLEAIGEFVCARVVLLPPLFAKVCDANPDLLLELSLGIAFKIAFDRAHQSAIAFNKKFPA